MLQYAKSIRNLANLYRDMEAAAEALESLGSVEQRAAEAAARTEKLRAEYEKLLGLRDEVVRAVEREQIYAKEAAQKALVECEVLVSDAKAKGSEIVVEAMNKADAIVGDARAAAGSIIATARDQETEVTNNIEALRVEYKALVIERDDVLAQVKAVHAQLDALRSKLSFG